MEHFWVQVLQGTYATGHFQVQILFTHCKRGIVITTDSLLFQIQMSEQNTLYVEENYMTIFSSFSANFPPHYHTILAINCVHASNWFTHRNQLDYCAGTYISTGLQYVKLPSLKTRSLNPTYQASSSRNQFKIQQSNWLIIHWQIITLSHKCNVHMYT